MSKLKLEYLMLVLIYTALISVFYRCESWSLTLSEELTLRVFENWVLRRMFGSKRDNAARDWRRLHDEELYDQYYCQLLLG
jgi:hypothetical protein